MGFSKNNICINPKFWEIEYFEMLYRIWKRRAPTNDEAPSKNISEILDTRTISIKEHEMENWQFIKIKKQYNQKPETRNYKPENQKTIQL